MKRSGRTSISLAPVVLCMALVLGISRAITKPDLSTRECLRRAHYRREPEKFECRDLGLCYKFYCQQVARRCSTCKISSIKPCLLAGKDETDAIGTSQPVTNDGLDRHSTNRSQVDNETMDVVSENLVQVTSGESRCSGFLAAVPVGRRNFYAVITAARCVADFSVTCTASNKYGNDTESHQSTHTCFGTKKSRVQSVSKGFRAYSATIQYKGRTISIGLNSKTTLVTRQYIECGDCRHDFAVLRLKNRQLDELGLSIYDAFTLEAKSKSALTNSPAILLSLDEVERCERGELNQSCTTSSASSATAGFITAVQKYKLCMRLAANFRPEQGEHFLLPGSPVLNVTRDNTSTTLISVLGVASHVVDVQLSGSNDASESVLRHQPVEVAQVASVVRFTRNLIRFIGSWLKSAGDSGSSSTTDQVHSKYDCFPSVRDQSANATLCICARGWTNERQFCNSPMPMSGGECTWKEDEKKAACGRKLTGNTTKSLHRRALSTEVVPGSTKKLSLVQNDVTGAEVEELLRHVVSLQVLVLDCNRLQRLPTTTFKYGQHLQLLSLRNNNITGLHKDSFRHNRHLLALSLANNSLTSLTKRHFLKLLRLRDLDVRHNKIERVSGSALRVMKKLERVRFSHNRLRSVPGNLFRKNAKLLEIWLDYNDLESIAPQTFAKCNNLHLVKLEGNKLIALPHGLLHENKLLTSLNLNNNKLLMLPNDLLDEQNYLEKVTINENPDLPPAITLSALFNSSCIPLLRGLLGKYGAVKGN